MLSICSTVSAPGPATRRSTGKSSWTRSTRRSRPVAPSAGISKFTTAQSPDKMNEHRLAVVSVGAFAGVLSHVGVHDETVAGRIAKPLSLIGLYFTRSRSRSVVAAWATNGKPAMRLRLRNRSQLFGRTHRDGSPMPAWASSAFACPRCAAACQVVSGPPGQVCAGDLALTSYTIFRLPGRGLDRDQVKRVGARTCR